jgi:putative ATPase
LVAYGEVLMADDLFAAAGDDVRRRTAPLADRLRPTSVDEVIGQRHLLGPGRPLAAMLATGRLSSLLLWGPPGTGKTTLSRLVAKASGHYFVALSAVSATVKDIRDTIAGAEQRLGMHGQRTVCFLDEIHRFNRAQQDALLPAVEDGTITLIGATTENPLFEVNPPLRSRCTMLRTEPLSNDDLVVMAQRGCDAERVDAAPEALALLAMRSAGDGRQLLTSLETAASLAMARHGATSQRATVEVVDVEAALATASVRYGVDDHYDVVSAFIKSIRGSDVDAALHWLARMLEAGEDARFIMRRLVILASEDIGLADPMSLVVATSAASALELVGLPEAALNMAQATIHLACAPKSNRVTTALGAARRDVQAGRVGNVPPHLRDGHHQQSATIGHGVGYRYPHDDRRGWVPQQYAPDDVVGRRYYEPSSHGQEPRLADRFRHGGDSNDGTGSGPTGDSEPSQAQAVKGE